jgi:hypothetical protein
LTIYGRKNNDGEKQKVKPFLHAELDFVIEKKDPHNRAGNQVWQGVQGVYANKVNTMEEDTMFFS